MVKSIETERKFKKAARKAGFKVEDSEPIICPEPVEDRRGEITKTTTVPDCKVIDIQTGKSMYVEVTNGSGNNPHKEAQKRVVEAAGVENYVMVTGNQVQELYEKPDKETKRAFLIALFNWLLMI